MKLVQLFLTDSLISTLEASDLAPFAQNGHKAEFKYVHATF